MTVPIIASWLTFSASSQLRKCTLMAAGYTRNIVLRERLAAVEKRIEDAVRRAGRRRSEITLIAVTKKFPAEVIREAHALGLRHFGENYVQEFEAKHPAVADLKDAEFHLIGHLQSNKTRT